MKKFLFLLLFIPSLSFGELSKTYPTSSVTTVRLSAYLDEIYTTAKSTWTVEIGTYTFFGSTRTYIDEDQYVTGETYINEGSTWVAHIALWTLQEYSDILLEDAKIRWISETLDKDIEQYLVWPSTNCPAGWKGWGSKVIGETIVPVSCQ